jgi:hypothetical protein
MSILLRSTLADDDGASRSVDVVTGLDARITTFDERIVIRDGRNTLRRLRQDERRCTRPKMDDCISGDAPSDRKFDAPDASP